MPNPRVGIVDYHMGNLFSVQQACNHVGLDSVITHQRDEILNADGLIFPGVGAFGDAMEHLRELDLIEPIKKFVSSGKPFMGICLGLQLLFSESEEFGKYEGLNIIEGKVRKLDPKHDADRISKVPQVGWNQLDPSKTWEQTPLKGIETGEYMYFVHSYYVQPEDNDIVLTQTDYEGVSFCSGILKDNIFAVQYHPEKSGEKGLKIYKNWAQSINH